MELTSDLGTLVNLAKYGVGTTFRTPQREKHSSPIPQHTCRVRAKFQRGRAGRAKPCYLAQMDELAWDVLHLSATARRKRQMTMNYRVIRHVYQH